LHRLVSLLLDGRLSALVCVQAAICRLSFRFNWLLDPAGDRFAKARRRIRQEWIAADMPCLVPVNMRESKDGCNEYYGTYRIIVAYHGKTTTIRAGKVYTQA